MGDEVSGEVTEGVVIGEGVGGEVKLELGLEDGVVVDGFDKGGEHGVGGKRLLEESKVGDVDSEGSKMGGKVGGMDETSF